MSRRNPDIEAIKQLAKNWRSGWLSGDVQLLLSLWADHPVLLPQGEPAVIGKKALRSLYQAVFRDYTFESKSRLMEVQASGDWGFFWSAYQLTATPKRGGAAIQDQGKSVFIVRRRRDGTWKIARLMDNSDQTPATGQ